MTITYSIISSNKPSTVAKHYSIVNGELTKEVVANITQGTVAVEETETPYEFYERLRRLNHNQCLVYGVAKHPGELVTKAKLDELDHPDTHTARTLEEFDWNSGPGVMFLDYDPPKDGSPPLQPDALVDLIVQACPELEDCAVIWYPSSSSYIYNGDDELTGLKGQRLYVLVKDASDIPRAGNVLNNRLWALGYGRFEVSSSGQLLERPIFDKSVWQPNHIDFAAGAVCASPLEQRRGDPQFVFDRKGLLDTHAGLPDLTPQESQAADQNRANEKGQTQPLAEAKRQVWKSSRAQAIMKAYQTLTTDQAKSVAERAIDSQELHAEYPIQIRLPTGLIQEATVKEVLENKAKYHGLLTLDPLEPEYDGSRLVGKLYLIGGRPNLFSFAHGGCNYRLIGEPERYQLFSGKTKQATDKMLSILRKSPDIYEFGQEVVKPGADGKLCILTENSLQYLLAGLVQCFEMVQRGNNLKDVLKDPPIKSCKTIIDLKGLRKFKELMGVITAPTMRLSGTVLDTPDYDAETLLLLQPAGCLGDIPAFPTEEQARDAIVRLWEPFTTFPFCEAVDRAVHLAALITATIRSTLPTSPAFAYDAPVQGSGKTLLARCVGVLAQGSDPSVFPHTVGRDDEEIRKRLFAVLRSGARVLVWDNVTGTFDSASMAAAITSPTYSDRVLGQSAGATVPNRMLLLITGNNLTLKGDLSRRVLVSRIDPRSSEPFARSFQLDPFKHCNVNRQDMVAAALTLIRAQLTLGQALDSNGKLASFEDWDGMVRRTVLYANTLQPGMFGDVMGAVVANQANDSEVADLGDLLNAWQHKFGSRPVAVSEVTSEVNRSHVIGHEDELRDAIEALTGQKVRDLTNKSLGRRIGYLKDRIVNGKRLEAGPNVGDKKTWRVVVV